MTELRDLERHTYQTLWEDGLLDLFVGAGLVLTGVAWLADVAWLGAIVPAILIAFWPVTRKSISAPRAGSFTPTSRRRVWEQRRLLALALAGVVTLGLAVVGFVYVTGRGSPRANWLAVLVPGLPGILVAAGLAGVGVAFGFIRFLAYAGASVATAALAVLGLFGPGWAFVHGGVAVLLWGGVILVRFLTSHPPLAEGSL